MARRRKKNEKDSTTEVVKQVAKEVTEQLYGKLEGNKPSLSFLLEQLLNAFMEKERGIFLSNLAHIGEKDYANGYYNRYLQLAIGTLNLQVPRIRTSKGFRPIVLPPKWKRVDRDYEEVLIALISNGYSESDIERALKKLNLPYDPQSIEQVRELILERLEVMRRSSIGERMFAVFIDAYQSKLRTEAKGSLEEITIYTVLGIDMDGYKHVLGFYTFTARESKELWVSVFKDLISRGLKKVLIFVTDDFSGLKEVVEKLFPYSDHQLCLLHLMRNLRKKLSREAYAQVKKYLYIAKASRGFEEGKEAFIKVVEVIREQDEALSQRIAKRADNYIAFLKYPEEVRKHIYTTNISESFNSGVERMRIELGGYFPSEESLNANMFILLENIGANWDKKPVPMVRARLYELRQVYAMKFELDTDDVLHI